MALSQPYKSKGIYPSTVSSSSTSLHANPGASSPPRALAHLMVDTPESTDIRVGERWSSCFRMALDCCFIASTSGVWAVSVEAT